MHPLIGPFDPITFDLPIGGLTIYSFGVLVALGFWMGNIAGRNKARRDGLDPEVINQPGWVVIGTFVGGHLGHALMYEPEEYFKNPIEFLKVWQGLSSFGGFIGCSIIVYLFFRLKKLPVMAYGDCVLYGLTLGWAFGRLGCFSVHDHPGTQTDFWLGVYGTCPGNEVPTVACHSLGLYEALHAFALFGLLRLLDRKPRFQGFYVGFVCLAYGPFRLALDALRHPLTDTRYFGFTPAQYLSTALTLAGIGTLLVYRNKPKVREMSGIYRAPKG